MAERPMTERGYDQTIHDLEAEAERLREERSALKNLAYDIRTFCPRGPNDKKVVHDWTVVRADECAVFGGGSVRSADLECPCGATMSIADGQSKVGG